MCWIHIPHCVDYAQNTFAHKDKRMVALKTDNKECCQGSCLQYITCLRVNIRNRRKKLRISLFYYLTFIFFWSFCRCICWSRVHLFHCLHQHFVLLPQHTYSDFSVYSCNLCMEERIKEKGKSRNRTEKTTSFIL